MVVSEIATEIFSSNLCLNFWESKSNYPLKWMLTIYLSKSATLSNRTRHIDTRYHFVREYIENGILKIVFVKSEDNDADIMTKNLCIRLYDKHQRAIMNCSWCQEKEEGCWEARVLCLANQQQHWSWRKWKIGIWKLKMEKRIKYILKMRNRTFIWIRRRKENYYFVIEYDW